MKTLQIKTLSLLVLTLSTMLLTAQEGTVTINQPKAVEQLLEYKKDIKTVETYKIQVYSGNSSTKAESVKAEFMSTFGEWTIDMVFNTPNYKIWVGNFRDRLEADRALLRIKKKYMNAFIFKPKKE